MNSTSTSTSPAQAVLQVIAGFWLSRCVYIAAKLGLADLVQESPKTPAELAVLTGTHAPSLYRVLRALASNGWLQEDDDSRFGPTALSAGLLTGAPGSLRALATTELGEEHYPAWGNLLFSVKTGELAFDNVFGMPNWQYWAGHDEHAQVFNRAMSEMTAVIEPAVLSICDFSPFTTIVDIGGGRGTLMSSILGAYPAARGIVLDLPHVIEQGRQLIAERHVEDRCELIPGDFFKEVPRGGDAYVLKWVLHDWDDEKAIAILRNCHRAMAPAGRLFVVEAPLSSRNEASLHKLMDVNMLVMTGGRERTEAEYRRLLDAAGFELTRVTATPLELAVLEASPK
ncbi:MAG TPA: methyltransferase [Xanthobacteraceae bacterium]|nr:methyltransferase [Xanthobacteraceae bacterium]